MSKEIRLKVAEAMQDDVNKGIVRIDSQYMKKIDVRPGDVVGIRGKRETVAIVDRSYPGDIGLNIIRMDGITRRNAKTSIGEYVSVYKVEAKEAEKIVIAPAQEGVVIRSNDPTIFRVGLLGRAVVKGDLIVLGGARRRRRTLGDSFYNIFDLIDETMFNFGFTEFKFIVVNVKPKDAPVIITDRTEIEILPEPVEGEEDKSVDVTYEDIGGLDEEIKKVRETIELPLKHPEIFERLGIEPPKGVLLYGPPGTGKTLLAKAVANESGANFILINGPEIVSKFYGESEANLRKKFEEAEKNAPSIIFIDEIDAIAPKREDTHGEVERRIVAQLLALMDGLKSRGKVIVIAATNMPNLLDPALRRPGRFDREIEIGVPNKEGREAILKIHTRNMPLYDYMEAIKDKDYDKDLEKVLIYLFSKAQKSGKIKSWRNFEEVKKVMLEIYGEDEKIKEIKIDKKKLEKAIEEVLSDPKVVDLEKIAEMTHGFVGADLAALSKEAAMEVLRRVLVEMPFDKDEPVPKEVLEKLKVTQQDFYEAMKVVRPSAMREVLIEVPNVTWNDIGDLKEVKQELKEAVEWPLKYKHVFHRLGIKPPKGVLLYGPPGTGKTLLAKAVANESGANFIAVKGPELLSKWVGESEKAVRKVFEKARQVSPAIIFMDEIDSLAPRRGMSTSDSGVTERIVNQLLTEMDGIQELNDVIVIAATNRPDILDPALLRPGRFDRVIFVSPPDVEGRLEILKVHTRNMPLAKDVDLQKIAEMTEGYVGADLEALCREAAMLALRKNLDAKEVTMKDFEEAMEKVRPSVSQEIVDAYKQFEAYMKKAASQQIKDRIKSYFG